MGVGPEDPRPLTSQCGGRVFLGEVELVMRHQGQCSRCFTCSAASPPFIMGHGETGGFLARGQAFWKQLAGTWGRRVEVCQYFNNWPSWPSCYKPHSDPVASGIHLCHVVQPLPTSANPGGWPLGGPAHHPACPLLRSLPASRILLKYFKTI